MIVMTNKEIYEFINKVGLFTFSTIYKNEIHSRIAHFNGYDEDGFYFRTMYNKPYARQLLETGRLTVCGHCGDGIINHEDVGASPNFAPGFSLRLIGEVKFVSPEEIIEKALTNDMLKVAARDIEAYPAMGKGNFVLYKGKGEIFDYDFEKIKRAHKLIRTRFAFGGGIFNPSGVKITDACIGCGKCSKVCSFDAIVKENEGTKYRVIGERCDDCGSCIDICPVDAIELSKVF